MIFWVLACETAALDMTAVNRTLRSHSLREAPMRWTGETGEGVGGAFAGGDVDGDGVADLVVGAHGPSGGAYVLLGPLTDGTPRDADISISAVPGWQVGSSVAFVGDLDGEGRADIAVGVPAVGGGDAWVFAAPIPGALGRSDAFSIFSGVVASQAGVRIGPAGDQDGDGRDDWLVGAWLDPTGGAQGGAIYILRGEAGTLTVDDAIASRFGATTEWAGYGASCAGDVDGDGIFDIVVGADGNDLAGEDAGAAYVERGPILGTAPLGGALLTGEKAGNFAGHGAIIAGDLFGTGRDTVVVGGFGAGAERRDGAAYVYSDLPESGLLAEADVRISGQPRDSLFGYALSSPGDVDGDGFGELIITARFDNGGGTEAGAAWLVYGPPAESLDLDSDAAVFLGESAHDDAGYAAGTIGDVDDDGRADLVFGAMANDAGGENAGAVYVWPGGL